MNPHSSKQEKYCETQDTTGDLAGFYFSMLSKQISNQPMLTEEI
jgi:hypothetical protein